MTKKQYTLELEIEDLAYGGKGVARKDNFVWFVRGGIPGQKVTARIRRKKKSYGEATIDEVIEPSPHQIEAPCPYFGICGGCQLQHLDYRTQLHYKTRQTEEILRRVGEINDPPVLPALGCKEQYGYRNKMEFSFSNKRWFIDENDNQKPEDFALGMHVPRRFDKVLDLDKCLLQSDTLNKILKTIKTLTLETGLPAYDTRNHTGIWRFLVLREGIHTGDIMVNLFTSGQEEEQVKHVIDSMGPEIQKNHPEITSLIHTVTDKKAQIAKGDHSRLLQGKNEIREKIADKIFRISPEAFFQTNTVQTEILFNTICDLADFRGTENVLDLYCGTGAIGIFIADKVKNIYGIEVVESAIADAVTNAEINNLNNIYFHQADIKEIMNNITQVTEKFTDPDVVILDPPRGGTHPKSIQGLLKMAPPKIIYISCNPAILARDLTILCKDQYTLKNVQPVDMFPHTGHIEIVAVLDHD
ncbi:MAG: 23S rRNA (uracil(1939)-C(5))-methyltransferase RlmD [bacterium]